MSGVYLKEQSYGKDQVRLVKVIRTGKWHEIVELTVMHKLFSCIRCLSKLNIIILFV